MGVGLNFHWFKYQVQRFLSNGTKSSSRRQVSRALARVARGNYGVCLYCRGGNLDGGQGGRATGPPSVINCQEQIDQREIEVDENSSYHH